jgi:hypothetical protein
MSRHTRDTGGTGAFGMRPSADASTPRLWSPIHLVAAGPSQSETPRVREEEPAATRHPIAIGLITVDATVQITFELLDQGR